MLPSYEHNNTHHHQYQFLQNEDPSSPFPISNPFTHQLFQPPPPPVFPVRFKLDLDTDIEQPPPPLPSWHPYQDSTSIKQPPPFWKQLSDKQHCENEEQHSEVNKSNFGELEAIYSLPKGSENQKNIETGSGSGEQSPENANPVIPFPDSENSNAPLRNQMRKKKKKRKSNPNLSETIGFLENLVKQVMDHQEMLHSNFLQVLERMDKERTQREEERRRHQTENYSREALTRAHEKSLALTREAQIVSYLQQITGQTINFPLTQI